MLTSILLMAPAGGQSSGYSSLIFLGLIMVVFYFFFIRPQAKKAKDLRKYREALKKGDKIVTIGGIHGKIVEVQETTFTIEVEDGSRLRIEKSAVAGDASDQLANQQK
ncbi:MAG: preprotein translocase subunit YajC [Lentimicrobiaceae bacterium]|nr:preprotein translocase subunit YajC [Lentimicrobiaceae bacterium]MCB9023705.1 preprotein translocase subunit YajC [Lentimicrobiaceae bacterium]MCO5266263.1 preprotein translocase subunit YajC [Lentimicrobium sp.]HPG34246.1 preprotein translocase subunit YajC [Lentimicrobium sp.]